MLSVIYANYLTYANSLVEYSLAKTIQIKQNEDNNVTDYVLVLLNEDQKKGEKSRKVRNCQVVWKFGLKVLNTTDLIVSDCVSVLRPNLYLFKETHRYST